ncbi:MAG: hypothetical protein AAFO84_15335 [Cyanobacteria bacterium J06598_1]
MTFSTANQRSIGNDLGSVHQSNVMTSLNHRLAVAKANHNQRLVSALEREYEQLTTLAQPVSVVTQLEKLWMRFATTLSDWSMVHIERTVDSSGQHSWYAYNPQSGQAVVTHSESDMNQWIRTHYWNQ